MQGKRNVQLKLALRHTRMWKTRKKLGQVFLFEFFTFINFRFLVKSLSCDVS